MTKSKPLPPLQELEEWFLYNHDTGELTWRKTRWYNAKAGQQVGSLCSTTGYIRVRLGGQAKYQAHRIAWYLYYGEDPVGLEIDHIDGNRTNNKISNLRAVTRTQNQANRAKNKNNTSGFTGVYLVNNKWMALLTTKTFRKFLGYYDTPEEASKAWLVAAESLRGPFFRARDQGC